MLVSDGLMVGNKPGFISNTNRLMMAMIVLMMAYYWFLMMGNNGYTTGLMMANHGQ